MKKHKATILALLVSTSLGLASGVNYQSSPANLSGTNTGDQTKTCSAGSAITTLAATTTSTCTAFAGGTGTASGTNTGDITIGTGNGLTLSGQAISDTCAGAGQPGPLCGSGANGTGQLTVDAGVNIIGPVTLSGVLTTTTQSVLTGGFTTPNSSSFTGGATLTLSGGGNFACQTGSGSVCNITNSIGASGASSTVAAFQFQQNNGALDSTDLEMSFRDSAGNYLLKLTELGNLTALGTVTGSGLSGTNTGDQTKSCSAGDFITTLAAGTGSTCATPPQGTVTSVTGTAPIVSSGGATPAISCTGAGANVTGCLTNSGGVLAVDAGFNAVGPILSGSTVTGSNLSGTNTGDQTKTCTAGQFVSTLAAGTGSTCSTPTAASTTTYTLNSQFTTVGNTADANEDTLMTYTLPAATLATNGTGVRITAWGNLPGTGTNPVLKCYFGATALFTSPAAFSTGGIGWQMTATLSRVGATSQTVGVTWEYGKSDQSLAAAIYVLQLSPAETLSGTVVIKCTGQDFSSTTNKVNQNGMRVEYLGI